MTAAQTEILSDQPGYRKTAGERLRRARELKGFSQKDVANALNLMVSHVRAIESNRYDAQAEGEHFGGYLRSYARLVDIDPQQIIELYMSQSESGGAADTIVLSPVQLAPQQQSRFKPGISIGFFAVVCLAVAVWAVSRLGVFGGDGEQTEIAVIPPEEAVVTSDAADPPAPVTSDTSESTDPPAPAIVTSEPADPPAPTINEPERERVPEVRKPPAIHERPAESEKIAEDASPVIAEDASPVEAEDASPVEAAVVARPERQARDGDIAVTGSVVRNADADRKASSISDQRNTAKPARQSLAAAARERREKFAAQIAAEKAANPSQAALSNIDMQQRATRTNRQSSRGVDREVDRRATQSKTPTLDNKLASVSGSDRLVLNFTTDCWVEVYGVNGEALRLGVERAGDKLMLRGKAPFDVLVGFSRGVTLELNGESVPIEQHQFSDSTQLVVGGPDDYFGTEQKYEDTAVASANESTPEELDYAREDTIDEELDDRQAIGRQATDEDSIQEQAAQEGQRAVKVAPEQLAAAGKRVDVPARYSRPFATPAPSTGDELETAARQVNTDRDDAPSDGKSPLVRKHDELQFTFSAECWVEVYDVEKRPLVMDTKYAGETLDLEGQGPFEVRVGNSRAVSLKVNGQKIEIKRDRYIGSTEFFVGSR